MRTGHAGQKHELGSDPPPAEKRTRSGRWILTTALPLLAATVAVAFAFTPLRETMSWKHFSRPKSQRLRDDLETALNQVYRAFELDEEAVTYDQIAQNVTGDAARDIYLEVRRSWMDEDGGRVSIDDVRLNKLDGIQWHPEGGCQVDATWVVRGTIGHFGHSHERQNRYRARIRMLSEAGAWRICSVQITEHEREK